MGRSGRIRDPAGYRIRALHDGGPEVKRFERQFAQHVDKRFVLFYDQGSGCLEQNALNTLVLRTTGFGMALSTPISLLIFCGAVGKSGQVPLHVWLPYAHPAAPSHVSALMSGVMIKTAIYALIRVYFDFLGGQFPWWWGFVVLSVPSRRYSA